MAGASEPTGFARDTDSAADNLIDFMSKPNPSFPMRGSASLLFGVLS